MTLRRRTAIVLFTILGISLALNLAVAGFGAARVLLGRPPPPIEEFVALGARAFPPDIRRAVVAAALERGPDLRAAIEAFREARRAVFAAMRADPLDAAALDAAFAEARTRFDALYRLGQAIMTEAVTKAPAAARTRIGDPDGE